MKRRVDLNNDWRFCREYTKKMAQPDYVDDAWETVRLPHTCVETPLHYFDESIYQMESCYRRHLDIPEEWKGKKILLTVDGAAHESEVFVNGEKAGEHHNGYTAFTMDISEMLSYGENNVVTVRVDSRENLNVPPFGHVIDYITYGGLYREVYLEVKEQSFIEDVFVRSTFSENMAKAQVISEISLAGDAAGMKVRQSMWKKGEEDAQALGEELAKEQMTLEYPAGSPELWDLEHPALYEVKTELLDGGRVVDEKIVTMGFRIARFEADGFYLNGRKVKLRGLNRHQSFPYVGYAMPESMQRRDAVILKEELGVNAVRTSHYPQSHYFLEQCDKIGLLVFTEIPGWQHIGDEAWKRQAVENVKEMVIQYRNHPSIILWGVRINESKDDDAFYTETNKTAHALDPSRQTGGVRVLKKSNLLEDVYTYNDFLHDGKAKGCDQKMDVTTEMSKGYLISEYNGHMYPTKAFDWEEHRMEHALRHARVLDAAAEQTDIAGSFGWCMFDYNTHQDFGSGDRICYHGVMDMFRNAKLASSVYASQQEQTPVLEISSSMDIGEHPGGYRGDIWMFTNADSVRMYKNGNFIKEYERKETPYSYIPHGPMMVNDFIGDAIEREQPYKKKHAEEIAQILNAAARKGVYNVPKNLMMKALKLMLIYHLKPEDAVDLFTRYIGDWGGTSTSYQFEAVKDGKVVKTVTKEPVKSLQLQVDTDHTELTEGRTYDVAAIRLRMADQNGNTLSFFNEPVTFETEGEIEIVGPKTAALSGGMGGTYIRTTGKAGTGTLTIKTAQTAPCTVAFTISKEQEG